MKYYVISDTHFGHKLLIDIGDREEGFEKQILKQIRLIPSGSILIHLGDICIGNDETWHNLLHSPLKRFKTILVRGNHDRKTNNWYLNHGRDFVCNKLEITIQKKKILFSHMPALTDDDNWKGLYDLNIHGHYHKRFDRDIGKEDKLWCYSCEYEKYVPKLVDNIIKDFFGI